MNKVTGSSAGYQATEEGISSVNTVISHLQNESFEGFKRMK